MIDQSILLPLLVLFVSMIALLSITYESFFRAVTWTFTAGLIVFVAYAFFVTPYLDDRVETCIVTGKDLGQRNNSYRIYTSNCGVLSNQNSIVKQKYNSEELWQKIPDQSTVTFRIIGPRDGFMDSLPNILEVQGVVVLDAAPN